jgi:tetratricopeptide (TPR) repeat protein
MAIIHDTPPQFENPGDWLRYIKNEGSDLSWIIPYENHLTTVIRRGLYTPRHFDDTIALLKLIIPYFITTLFHAQKWLYILMDALIQAEGFADNKLQAELMFLVGQAHLQSGRQVSANEAFETALEHGANGALRESMVASYAGMFKLQWFDLSHPLAANAIKRALTLADQIDDLALKATLHDALAHAYIRLGENQVALGHGQMALVYASNHENKVGLGRACFTLAMIYRLIVVYFGPAVCLKHADMFLQMARSTFATVRDNWLYPLIAYETGTLLLQRGEYQAAKEWLEIALVEANNLQLQHHRAVAHHALGLVQTALKEYDAAQENLEEAIGLWVEMQNVFEHASALQALGYLYGLKGEIPAARKLLNGALRLCGELPAVPLRQTLRKNIQDSIDELPDEARS